MKEGFANCESDVVSVVKAAVESMKKTGATVEEVNVPMHTHGTFPGFPY